MPNDDLAYWKQRAEQQLKLAAKAEHPNARSAHQALADYYLERANKLLVGIEPVVLAR